ncbi:MAG: hypothetical protein JO057_01675 [Chloroflexi bacterium]|nr:hypothetical protein [Chloroflexota bacterium]
MVDTCVVVPLVVADHEHHRAAIDAVGSKTAAASLARLGTFGVASGTVYDALVGAAAVEHGLTLLRRDGRAASTSNSWLLDQ